MGNPIGARAVYRAHRSIGRNAAMSGQPLIERSEIFYNFADARFIFQGTARPLRVLPMMNAHRLPAVLSRDAEMKGRADQILRDLESKGYHLLPGLAQPHAVEEALRQLQTSARRRTPLSEERTEQTWDEIAVPTDSSTARTICPPDIEPSLRACFGPLTSRVYWANHYTVGEYIPPHMDTQGDLQIVMPLALPPEGFGGRLRICHRHWNEILMRVGDRIIFEARKTPHSTTPVLPGESPEVPTYRRIVGVCRLFFDAGPAVEPRPPHRT